MFDEFGPTSYCADAPLPPRSRSDRRTTTESSSVSGLKVWRLKSVASISGSSVRSPKKVPRPIASLPNDACVVVSAKV